MDSMTPNSSSAASIHLRALEPGDLDLLYRWENEQEIWTYGVIHQPISREALRNHIADSIVSDIYTSRQLRLIGEDNEGKVVGCVDLFDFDPYHRRAAVGVLVDRSLRHQGYGAQLLDQLHHYAASQLQLHQLHCIVAAHNEASLQLFHQAGYRESGRLTDWIFDGKQWQEALFLQHHLDNNNDETI